MFTNLDTEDKLIIKTKTYESILVLLLLFVGMSFQPFTTIGSNQETMSNQITEEPMSDTSSSEIINSDGVLPNSLIQEESSSESLQSPFADSTLRQRMIEYPISQQENEIQNLPENIKTWSAIKDENPNVKNSPYLTIQEDALIKIHNAEDIETLVKVNTLEKTSEINAFFAAYNIKIVEEYPILAIYVVLINANFLDQFISASRTIEDIAYVQPNYYYSASFLPNDTEWINQYGPQVIGMENAWDIELGNTSVVVAIIDTGIDYTHPDLGNYLPIGYDWYNNDPDPMDDNGHGTHVAGTIAASINNALGIAGVANVSFFAEKFLDQFGFGSDIGGANAIIHAVDVGANILSNSWGGYGESLVLEDAVNYAISNGVIVVAAAGNGATDALHYPAAYPDVIAVTATDQFNNIAGFSNFGSWIDIAAPGVDIISTVPWGYDYFSGTSMATPHVSGLLALLKSHFPTYDNLQLENLIYTTAVDFGLPGFDEKYGWGRIDASSAILGLQDHNLRANVISENVIPGDQISTLSGRVTNLGLLDELNVNITLSIDGVTANATTIAFLPSGSSFDLLYDFLPPTYGFYNISVAVDPVLGEEILTDNFVFKLIEATPRIINPQLGSELAYGPINGNIPYELRWNIVDDTDPLANIMDLWIYDETSKEEWLVDTFVLNPYTREYESIFYSDPGRLFPYWIQTDIQIGDVFDLFFIGDQQGYVVDEGFIEYYGDSIPVWIVDDGFELVFFSKSDGVLVALRDYNLNPIFYDLIYGNVLSEASNLHNTRVAFGSAFGVEVGIASNIEIFVQNTGIFYEETQVILNLNNETLGFEFVFLNPGQGVYLLFSWTPPALGDYIVDVDLLPVFDEFYLEDNFRSKIITVAELENYVLSNPTFEWYDAMANGQNLNFFGDDISTSVGLPFNFQFYDQSFSTVYVSSNGWLSFSDSNPVHLWNPGFPSSEFPYALSLFWDDLIAEGNVYAWSTPDFVVIEYNNYNYLWGELAGTFEVVFFATGEILFQYQNINTEYSTQGKGINYGLNLNYFTVFYDSLTGVPNFAAKFFKGASGGELDVAAGLNIPNDLEAGKLGYIQAFVQNIGLVDADFVELSLFIDGEQVATIFTDLLLAGEILWLSHYWVPPYNGQFLVEAIVTPIVGESNVENNFVSEYAVVGAIHDLVVFLEITHLSDQDYVIDATVMNIGETEEYNVELFIYINGDPVALGEIETLKVGLSFIVRHYWTTNEAAEVAVFATYLPNEVNLDNNLVVEWFEPILEQNGYIGLQVNDLITDLAIVNADVYISGMDYFSWGQTNSSGGFETVVPLGEYWIDILKDGYLPQNFYVSLLNPGDLVFLFVQLEPVGELFPFEVHVEDQLTAVPIEGAEVYISGPGYFVFGFTDQNGTFLTELPLGDYWIDVLKDGYFRESFNFIFDVPENNLLFIFLETFGDLAQLDVIVIDLLTDQPIAFADVNIGNPSYFEYGQTNETGIYSTSVPLGEYWIDVFKPGYYWASEYIIIDNPDQFYGVVIYLEPESTGPVEFNIISPTGNEIVDGALVQVFFEATNSFEIEFIDVFINDQYITTVFYLPELTIFVPIFMEGYNNITLMAQWYNGQIAWTSVLIESINLQPYSLPQIGDYLHFRFELFYIQPTLVIDFNLTVIDWISSDEVLFDLVYHQYDEFGTIELSNFYLVVNVLNGYVSDSDMWWLYQHFYFFSGLKSSPTANLGDSFPFWSWGNVLTITGESMWNNMDVWVFNDAFGFIEGYVIKENGLFVYYNQDNGIITGEIVDSSMFPNVIEPPVISDLADLTYEEGSLNNQLSWTATSEIPDFYIILLDGVDIDFGNWTSLDVISIIIDGLLVGQYLFEIFVFDLYGNYAYDQVIVTVIDSTAPFVSSPEDIAYDAGSTGNNITWLISDLNPENYTILMDGNFVTYGTFNPEDFVTINIDGLDPGIYEFEIFAQDKYSNYAYDIVIVEVIDITPPTVRGQTDFTYEEDSTDNYISWIVSGDPSGTYQIYVDYNDDYDEDDDDEGMILLVEGSWTDEETIEINIDGLDVGRYEFSAIFFDEYGNSKSDVVIVYVIPTEEDLPGKGRIPGFEAWFSIIALLGATILIRRRKLNS